MATMLIQLSYCYYLIATLNIIIINGIPAANVAKAATLSDNLNANRLEIPTNFKRDDVYPNDLVADIPQKEVYPSANIEPNGLVQDSFTNRLIDSIATADSNIQEKDITAAVMGSRKNLQPENGGKNNNNDNDNQSHFNKESSDHQQKDDQHTEDNHFHSREEQEKTKEIDKSIDQGRLSDQTEQPKEHFSEQSEHKIDQPGHMDETNDHRGELNGNLIDHNIHTEESSNEHLQSMHVINEQGGAHEVNGHTADPNADQNGHFTEHNNQNVDNLEHTDAGHQFGDSGTIISSSNKHGVDDEHRGGEDNADVMKFQMDDEGEEDGEEGDIEGRHHHHDHDHGHHGHHHHGHHKHHEHEHGHHHGDDHDEHHEEHHEEHHTEHHHEGHHEGEDDHHHGHHGHDEGHHGHHHGHHHDHHDDHEWIEGDDDDIEQNNIDETAIAEHHDTDGGGKETQDVEVTESVSQHHRNEGIENKDNPSEITEHLAVHHQNGASENIGEIIAGHHGDERNKDKETQVELEAPAQHETQKIVEDSNTPIQMTETDHNPPSRNTGSRPGSRPDEEYEKSPLMTATGDVRGEISSAGKRYESAGKRYESADKRYESARKRYESADKRYEPEGKRYEAAGKSYDEKSFSEYRHYPNEYTTTDENHRGSKRTASLEKVKDAVNVDTDSLKKEFAAIREEDAQLGASFRDNDRPRIEKEKSFTGETRNLDGNRQYNRDNYDNHYRDNKESRYSDSRDSINYNRNNEEKVQTQLRDSLTPAPENTAATISENTTDEDDDLEKETSELLNINVETNGKIVDANKKDRLLAKEAIFDRQNLKQYLKIPTRTKSLYGQVRTLPSGDKETQLKNDIAYLKDDLKSSLESSNNIMKVSADDYELPSLAIIRKNILSRPLGVMLNSSLPQAFMLETMSPAKRSNVMYGKVSSRIFRRHQGSHLKKNKVNSITKLTQNGQRSDVSALLQAATPSFVNTVSNNTNAESRHHHDHDHGHHGHHHHGHHKHHEHEHGHHHGDDHDEHHEEHHEEHHSEHHHEGHHEGEDDHHHGHHGHEEGHHGHHHGHHHDDEHHWAEGDGNGGGTEQMNTMDPTVAEHHDTGGEDNEALGSEAIGSSFNVNEGARFDKDSLFTVTNKTTNAEKRHHHDHDHGHHHHHDHGHHKHHKHHHGHHHGQDHDEHHEEHHEEHHSEHHHEGHHQGHHEGHHGHEGHHHEGHEGHHGHKWGWAEGGDNDDVEQQNTILPEVSEHHDTDDGDDTQTVEVTESEGPISAKKNVVISKKKALNAETRQHHDHGHHHHHDHGHHEHGHHDHGHHHGDDHDEHHEEHHEEHHSEHHHEGHHQDEHEGHHGHHGHHEGHHDHGHEHHWAKGDGKEGGTELHKTEEPAVSELHNADTDDLETHDSEEKVNKMVSRRRRSLDRSQDNHKVDFNNNTLKGETRQHHDHGHHHHHDHGHHGHHEHEHGHHHGDYHDEHHEEHHEEHHSEHHHEGHHEGEHDHHHGHEGHHDHGHHGHHGHHWNFAEKNNKDAATEQQNTVEPAVAELHDSDSVNEESEDVGVLGKAFPESNRPSLENEKLANQTQIVDSLTPSSDKETTVLVNGTRNTTKITLKNTAKNHAEIQSQQKVKTKLPHHNAKHKNLHKKHYAHKFSPLVNNSQTRYILRPLTFVNKKFNAVSNNTKINNKLKPTKHPEETGTKKAMYSQLRDRKVHSLATDVEHLKKVRSDLIRRFNTRQHLLQQMYYNPKYHQIGNARFSLHKGDAKARNLYRAVNTQKRSTTHKHKRNTQRVESLIKKKHSPTKYGAAHDIQHGAHNVKAIRKQMIENNPHKFAGGFSEKQFISDRQLDERRPEVDLRRRNFEPKSYEQGEFLKHRNPSFKYDEYSHQNEYYRRFNPRDKSEEGIESDNNDEVYSTKVRHHHATLNGEEHEGFINPWRSSSSLEQGFGHLTNQNIVSATGLKRENIFEKRKKLEQSTEEANDSKSKILRITVKSVGCFDPPFHGNECEDTVGSIIVNGIELSPNKPGFNLVLLDYKTGEMEQAVNFDTHGKAGEYEKLEEFLSSLEMWKIICIAVKNDAKNYLPESALKSFIRIGAADIISQQIEYRSSYAFVGLTGPEKARTKLDWIREENSRAGDGPSIISVTIKAGIKSYKAAGGKVRKTLRPKIDDNITGEERSPKETHSEEIAEDDDSSIFMRNRYHEAKRILNTNRDDISKYRNQLRKNDGTDNLNRDNLDKEDNSNEHFPESSNNSKAFITKEKDKEPETLETEKYVYVKYDGDKLLGKEKEVFKEQQQRKNNRKHERDASEIDLVSKKDVGKTNDSEILKVNLQSELAEKQLTPTVIGTVDNSRKTINNNAPEDINNTSASKQKIEEMITKIMHKSSNIQKNVDLNSKIIKEVTPSLQTTQKLTEMNKSIEEKPIISNLLSHSSLLNQQIGSPVNSVTTREENQNTAVSAKKLSTVLSTPISPGFSTLITAPTVKDMTQNTLIWPWTDALITADTPVLSPTSADILPKLASTRTPALPEISKFIQPVPLTDPVSNLLEAARKIGLNTDLLSQNVFPNTNIERVEPSSSADFIQNFVKPTKGDTNDTVSTRSESSRLTSSFINNLLEDNKQPTIKNDFLADNKSLPTVNELLAKTIASLKAKIEENKLLTRNEEPSAKTIGTAIDHAYGSAISSPLPKIAVENIEPRPKPKITHTNINSDSASTVDFSETRNTGESRLASALSSLGLPDAGATGIASLMASGLSSVSNNKKDAALKLGLAAKLAKSIADLGGRGAASAAGIASLNELLKDGRELTISRLAEQLGQALQRVGGAGAAVGYSALAAALKSNGGKHSPGELVSGVILALAEQGSAPGTAGLAALAAGLGGSGADALASGLGGSLPNVLAAVRTNNFLSGSTGINPSTLSGTTRETNSVTTTLPGATYEDILPRPASVTTPLTAETFVQQPPSISSALQYHPGNIETEYTGQGPIGSVSQGNFANAAKLIPNQFVNPEPVAALSTNGHHTETTNNQMGSATYFDQEGSFDHDHSLHQPSESPILASNSVSVSGHMHEAGHPLQVTQQVTQSTVDVLQKPVMKEPTLTPELIKSLLAKFADSLKSKTSSSEQPELTSSMESKGPIPIELPPPKQIKQQPDTVEYPTVNLERKVNLNEVLTSALGQKEGISLPELIAELQHPVQENNSAAEEALVNQVGTHMSSGFKNPGCCGEFGGEVINHDSKQYTQPSVLTSAINCGIPYNKNFKRCLSKCKDRKELYGRLIDLQSSDTKAIIKINGEDWSKDENGFNIVVLDFTSGEVEATETFDTEIDGGAAKAMLNFIQSLHSGKVILLATKGRAGRLMNEEAYGVLKETGARKLFTKHLSGHDKYVSIGYKGDDVVSWEKENLNEASLEGVSLIEPIVVGPGAMKNSCVCLNSCTESESEDKKLVVKPQKDAVDYNSEKAYADMGGDPIAAGSVGTKRMVGMVPRDKHHKANTHVKIHESLDHIEESTLENREESMSLAKRKKVLERQEARKKIQLEAANKNKQLEAYTITDNNIENIEEELNRMNSKINNNKIKETEKIKTDDSAKNYNEVLRKYKLKISELSRLSKKENVKLQTLKQKLNNIHHKNHVTKKTKSHHQSSEKSSHQSSEQFHEKNKNISSDILTLLANRNSLKDVSANNPEDEVSYNGAVVITNQKEAPLKEEALSLVNEAANHNAKKHKQEELTHIVPVSEMKPVVETPLQTPQVERETLHQDIRTPQAYQTGGKTFQQEVIKPQAKMPAHHTESETLPPQSIQTLQAIETPQVNETNYDDVYSTIGSNLHSRSERPRPPKNL